MQKEWCVRFRAEDAFIPNYSFLLALLGTPSLRISNGLWGLAPAVRFAEPQHYIRYPFMSS